MSKVAITGNASGTGVFTVASPNSNVDRVLTLPDESGTVLTTVTGGIAINGPAFSAYISANQSITTGTWTKVACNTEEFDTAGAYDNATNYRFTPQVAGYYQVSGGIVSTVASTLIISQVYKNGVAFKKLGNLRATISANTGAFGTALIYLNGSTDYLELFGYIAGTSPSILDGGADNYFQAFLARSA